MKTYALKRDQSCLPEWLTRCRSELNEEETSSVTGRSPADKGRALPHIPRIITECNRQTVLQKLLCCVLECPPVLFEVWALEEEAQNWRFKSEKTISRKNSLTRIFLENLTMADGFNEKEKNYLLVACHRRCCVCHRFCGSKMELDHIVPKADGGGNEIQNAIAVCFDCHAEIHHYNNKHPKGRKFTPDEISGHKSQWLEICKNRPEIFIPSLSADVGCIGALIDELEFNHHSSMNVSGSFFSPLRDEQFRRAITAGIVSILREDVKISLLSAYHHIGKANNAIQAYSQIGLRDGGMLISQTADQVRTCAPLIDDARNKLQQFLDPDNAD